jgi:hypothetical protein
LLSLTVLCCGSWFASEESQPAIHLWEQPARDELENAAGILNARVIVDDHREQAVAHSFVF